MKNLTTFVNEASGSTQIIDAMKNALKEELNAWYGYVIVKEWLTGTDRKDIERNSGYVPTFKGCYPFLPQPC